MAIRILMMGVITSTLYNTVNCNILISEKTFEQMSVFCDLVVDFGYMFLGYFCRMLMFFVMILKALTCDLCSVITDRFITGDAVHTKASNTIWMAVIN